jgi:hypothetical protein
MSEMNWMEALDQNLKTPMTRQQIEMLREYGIPFNERYYELFKSTVKYDGDLGPQQHAIGARDLDRTANKSGSMRGLS